MQAYIDRLVAARDKNDIEINAMLLNGDTSAAVASNIPANAEPNDVKEHADQLRLLEDD